MDHSPTVGVLVRKAVCSRFPFAFVDDPLKLATTINSPARVSCQARIWKKRGCFTPTLFKIRLTCVGPFILRIEP